MSAADWMPGIDHDPGENAGYNGGQADMVSMVIHYTAGAYGGDYAVGKRGYFNFYCPRERPAVQFAEANAITWHAGAWNGLGPGIEMERRDDSVPYTDHQLDDLGRIAHWLHDRYGIPLRFYDTGGDNGARIGVDASRGLSITHRSLAQSGGWHSDYVTRDEWERALGGAEPEPIPEPLFIGDDVLTLIEVTNAGNNWSLWVSNAGGVCAPVDTKTHANLAGQIGKGVVLLQIDQGRFAEFQKQCDAIRSR